MSDEARMREALRDARDAIHQLCLERGSTDGYGPLMESLSGIIAARPAYEADPDKEDA